MQTRYVMAAFAVAAVLFLATSARAALPDTNTLLGQIGLSADEIAQVQAGKFVTITLKPASDRELVTGTAFQLNVAPAALVKELEGGLFTSIDPNTISTGVISTPATAADFAKLKLAPDAEKQASAYRDAKPGDELNLSAEEIAAFTKLGKDATVAAVEEQIRANLVARVEAYRARGLSGMAPYARKDGQRSPAEELRNASQASQGLKTYLPALYDLLVTYPQSKPADAKEAFRWTLIDAHGVPTITLSHALLAPEGDSWVAIQRQFYVSTGYNAEQAIVAFLPVQTATVVAYTNRTSTDQVTGFGGGAKRSIGSKMLASQLQGLFEKLRTAVK